MQITRNLALIGLGIVGASAFASPTVIYSPKIVNGTSVGTGIEARFVFAPRSYDSSVSGTYNLGDVGPTARISNDLATLVDTVYTFDLHFQSATGMLTWSVMGGPLVEPSVLVAYEIEAFNSLRFNTRTMDPAHTLSWTDLKFDAIDLVTVGSEPWPSSGSVTNALTYLRLAAGPGEMLSSYDWSMSGKVSTNAAVGSQNKIWIASHMLELKPIYSAPSSLVEPAALTAMSAPAVSAVPEVSSWAMMALGLAGLVGYRRRKR